MTTPSSLWFLIVDLSLFRCPRSSFVLGDVFSRQAFLVLRSLIIVLCYSCPLIFDLVTHYYSTERNP